MGWHKRFVVVLVLLFLGAVFVAAPHHHAKADDERDCPICLAILHLHTAVQSAATFDGIPCFYETTASVPAPEFPELTSTLYFGSRAPPA